MGLTAYQVQCTLLAEIQLLGELDTSSSEEEPRKN